MTNRFNYNYTFNLTHEKRVPIGVATASIGPTKSKIQVLPSAPQFQEYPYGQTVNAGETVIYSASATGRPPLFYQWRKNGILLGGATNSTLNINQAQNADAGYYTVEVSNSAGSETSIAALLSINKPPTFVDLQPLSVAEQVTLSVQLKVADIDLPAQKLTVRLVSGPPGLVVSQNGLVSWTLTEAQGGVTYPYALT